MDTDDSPARTRIRGQGPGGIPCPYCSFPCECDTVDVGIGTIQCGPYHCLSCGASEIGPYDKERDLSEEETRTGWYAPGSPPGSSANVIAGKIVSSRVMREVYRREFIGNPLHSVPGYVDEWRENLARPAVN